MGGRKFIMDYQKTVNLPQTDFSMKAGLAQKEPALLEKWEKEGLYAKILQKFKGKKSFILHDGPPYANGNIHIGHALNKILKDFIVKMKTMQGFDSHYIPGWDCHGLPIEHQLLKDLKKHKSEVDCVDFRKKAHDYAMKYVDIQREQFKRLGVFGDWQNPYLTLAPEYEFRILNSLARLTKDGYVYRGLKPVNWCFSCETALAEAEVEYENHTSPSVYVKFKVNNPQVISDLPNGKAVYLLIWTTTPWTLLANVAVAVHHTYKYVLVDTGKDILIIESSLSAKVLEKGGVTDYKILKEAKGDEFKGLFYTHPFDIKKDCRVITVDYVTKEDGTGLVHTAPGHGQEDFQAGHANKLEILMPVNSRGVFTDEAKEFAGQHVFKANENIINALRSRGTLLASENITHTYPHCWRCKNPVIFRATHQWFLKIDHKDLRGKLKEVIKHQVEWIPEAGIERILGMIVGRPDWCLSRQRYWGVPIPAIICKNCSKENLFPEVIERFAGIVKKEGSDAWFEKDLNEILPANFQCPDCGGKEFSKSSDILDVWFDSGVSHQAVIKPMLSKEIPVEMYLEGSDQHRGWFQSSLIPAVAMEGKAPYKSVLTHGFVMDGQGRKMSKSLGNVISPLDVIKNSGAEILRLWVASSDYNEDIRISKEILDRLVDAYRKIRNTFRYLLGNLSDFDPNQDLVVYEKLPEVDQWALSKLSSTIKETTEAYNQYQFGKVYKSIYSFCNEALSSFYLDILKDRLYTFTSKSVERRSAQTVLYHILNYFVRVLAPVLTFTADEIFAAMPKEKSFQDVSSIHLLEWLEIPRAWSNPDIDEKFQSLIQLRPFVLKALEEKRRLGEIGGSLEAKVILQVASERDFQYLQKLKSDLSAIFIVSQVELNKVAAVKQGISETLFPQVHIIIEKAEGQKCGRCWNYKTSVGKSNEYPELCDRCRDIVQRMPAEKVNK